LPAQKKIKFMFVFQLLVFKRYTLMNTKTTFAFRLALGLAAGLAAQEHSFGTLPLAQKPGAPILPGDKIEDTPQYLKAMEGCNRLVRWANHTTY
jgi:hypothetical protein